MNARTAVSRFLSAALLLLATAAPVAAQEPPDFTITPAERKAAIEGAIKALNEAYVFPDVAKKMEQAVRARAAMGEYDSITSAKEFAKKLTDDFRAVSNDKHLGVRYYANGAPDFSAPPPPEHARQEREWMQKTNYGFEKVERLRGNIGYVDIRGFVPPADGGATASAAMSFIANTDALIVDLRKNGGGEPAMIAYVTSYLFDEPTHLNDIWERVGDKTQQWWTAGSVPGLRFGGAKPVYVLTSSRTFSGGEEFANNLKVLGRATVIGETTGGGAHPVQPYRISERFGIGVPFARAINPITKTNWEGSGVAPDLAMPADEAFDAAYDLAIRKLIETSTDERWKGQLESLLAERKKP
ncbi:MAG TPA: S41 family peptidase [Thermoanaerobaculia bacterium]